MGAWPAILESIRNPESELDIAVVGKYGELQDAYKSIYEAIDHGGIAHRCKVNIHRVLAKEVDEKGAENVINNVDGILVPGGFGARDIEGKLKAIRYARENNIPFFGICLGLQCAAIEFARHVCGLENANTTEIEPDTDTPVISLMEEQKEVVEKGATMRLGTYDCQLTESSKAYGAYNTLNISERHRHRYEFNNSYKKCFEENGAVFSGINKELDLVEIFEIKNHPWFVACQFHPEFKSYPITPHPLFQSFIGAAGEMKGE